MPQTASSVDSSGSDTVFLRTGAWGMAAVLALGTLVYAAQSDSGTVRMQIAVIEALGTNAPTVTARTAPASPALEARLEQLSAERTRLETRLAALEHGLEDVTGSIRREKVEPKPAAVTPFIEPPVIPPLSTLPPSSTVAAIPAEPVAETVAPVDAAPAAVPIPPARPAARPAGHVEYGVELGTAADLDALRTRWTGVKANFGPLLSGLSPVAVKDKRPGSTQLRLMAGPLKSMAAARELCAKFVAANGYCWPTRVDTTDVVQR